MSRLPIRPAAAALALLFATLPAVAQVIVDPKLRNTSREGRPASSANLSPLARAAWPRLDPGSTICRTRADLDAHRRTVSARLDGQPVPFMGSSDCRVISAPTAIDVVTRAGPGETEVRIKGDAATAWTDTWLPSQPPR